MLKFGDRDNLTKEIKSLVLIIKQDCCFVLEYEHELHVNCFPPIKFAGMQRKTDCESVQLFFIPSYFNVAYPVSVFLVLYSIDFICKLTQPLTAT